ncbi:hypothetical protein HPB49_006293 [Dermacentor silvarum]|uniref:Uncharacterized protein n=1 Tax=Dermacentor silvarum TaxID=543639 RepID=A0ACB8CVE5_DERSI|nr:hypothetical protein HPB49_006293 [Dermacentor silvarum]
MVCKHRNLTGRCNFVELEPRPQTDERPTGPSFVMEPPSRVTFYNSTGALVPCTVQGDPRPDVHWVRASTGLPSPRRTGCGDGSRRRYAVVRALQGPGLPAGRARGHIPLRSVQRRRIRGQP